MAVWEGRGRVGRRECHTWQWWLQRHPMQPTGRTSLSLFSNHSTTKLPTERCARRKTTTAAASTVCRTRSMNPPGNLAIAGRVLKWGKRSARESHRSRKSEYRRYTVLTPKGCRTCSSIVNGGDNTVTQRQQHRLQPVQWPNKAPVKHTPSTGDRMKAPSVQHPEAHAFSGAANPGSQGGEWVRLVCEHHDGPDGIEAPAPLTGVDPP